MASPLAKFAKYLAYGTEIAMSPVAGAIVGHALDVYFHTDPILAIIMTFAGVVVSGFRLAQMVRELRPK
jgi:F0F1-type ATP synthase assembly protein I